MLMSEIEISADDGRRRRWSATGQTGTGQVHALALINP